MSLTPSTMLPLGTEAPDFNLYDLNGKSVTLNSFKGSDALLIVFMCNHCPYVKHIIKDFSALVREYQLKKLGVAGINSNDTDSYPEDSPEKMTAFSKENNFTFPYLLDETQQVARKYRASCTPDFFLFDAERKLVYRGQMDDSRPGNDKPITSRDLRAAIDAVLAGKPVSDNQKPSMGCNIKWKAGNEPDYF